MTHSLRFSTSLLLAALLGLSLAATAMGDEPARLSLLAPNSLAGWDYGPPLYGWKAADGKLTGAADSSLLLSGWSFGDFSLRFRYTVAFGGTLSLRFPEAPKGQGLVVEFNDAGRATVSGTSGGAVAGNAGPAGAPHSLSIERTGGELMLSIDNVPGSKFSVGAEARFGLALAAKGNEVTIWDITAAEPPGEPIFNGHDLKGWWSPGGLKSWQAVDGVIECLNQDGNYLRTEKSYGNFTLSLEYKASKGCNSGIGIRTAKAGWPSGDGFELQILDTPGLTGDSTMSLYRNMEPLLRADRPEQWNSAVIKADGPMISAWVNGQLVQQADTARHPELKHRNHEGWIGLQDHGGKIEFRNLRVLESPAGAGLPAWLARQPLTGPELVADRLLNPAVLSLADQTTSGVAAASASGAGDQTLAELKGPGIVTRIWRSQPAGKLGFFFDDQELPAIDCPAAELTEHLPMLYEQKDPAVCCLPYAKSLKIVLRGGKGTDYRIEYVKLPDYVPVETFDPDRPVLPRGWLAAIDYRGHQYKWGTHREADPESRASGEIESLEPGATATLVTHAGKGIAQWLKLQTTVAMLKSDDLWLEILIDGETEPSIAAPARYFFPSLPGSNNHDGFLAVYREGFTDMLAMPFANGITVRARNAGNKPLKRTAREPGAAAGLRTRGLIGATLSLVEDDPTRWADQDLIIDRRMRLRGRFHRAADAGPWLDYRGTGRLVGLVAQVPKQGSLGVATVKVDGADLAGWSGVGLDALLGASPVSGQKGNLSKLGALLNPENDPSELFLVDAGRSHGLAWRYWQMAPIGFEQSIIITPSGPATDCLTLFYGQ